jgi:hypothetical protein
MIKSIRFIFAICIITLLVGCQSIVSEDSYFNDSADRQNLESLEQSGVDLTQKHNVDFQIAIKDEISGEKVKQMMMDKNFTCSLEKDFEGNQWTCTCSQEMPLELNAIVEIQKMINKEAKKYGGYSDGWGVMVKPSTSSYNKEVN